MPACGRRSKSAGATQSFLVYWHHADFTILIAVGCGLILFPEPETAEPFSRPLDAGGHLSGRNRIRHVALRIGGVSSVEGGHTYRLPCNLCDGFVPVPGPCAEAHRESDAALFETYLVPGGESASLQVFLPVRPHSMRSGVGVGLWVPFCLAQAFGLSAGRARIPLADRVGLSLSIGCFGWLPSSLRAIPGGYRAHVAVAGRMWQLPISCSECRSHITDSLNAADCVAFFALSQMGEILYVRHGADFQNPTLALVVYFFEKVIL